MGVGYRPSSWGDDSYSSYGNPQPHNWKLVREERVGSATVLEVIYPNCGNYEGRKIMVYEASGLAEIMKKNEGKLDPHFQNSTRYLSPVARFAPNSDGWANALRFARTL